MLGEEFTLLAPIFYLVIIFIICNFLYLTFFTNKINAKLYILLNSIFILVIALVLLFQEGILIDEFNKSGNYINLILTIISGLIIFLSIFKINNKKNEK